MGVKKTDISQIKKYLAGELDAKAMHQLERRAQDDPFLQDAIDGFEAKGFDQPGLDALNIRLQERINKKEARVIRWRTLSIAASILIVIGLGGVWLLNRNTEKNKVDGLLEAVSKPLPNPAKQKVILKPDSIPHQVAANSKPVAPKLAQADAPAPVNAAQEVYVKATKKAAGAQYASSSGNPKVENLLRKTPGMAADTVSEAVNKNGLFANSAVDNAKKDSSTNALSDMIMAGYSAKKKKDSTHLVIIGADKNRSFGYLPPQKNDSTYMHSLAANVSGTIIEQPGGAAANTRPYHVVNGQFLPADNRRLSKPNNASLGNDITADDGLVRAGYYNMAQTHRVKKSVKDSLSMAAAATSPVIFNEEKNKNVADTLNARPVKGWKALTDYLNTNAKSADSKTGLLKISFTVEASGLLDNFKIVYSLSPANDRKVADLLRNGPVWAPNASGKPETVTLTVRVH